MLAALVLPSVIHCEYMPDGDRQTDAGEWKNGRTQYQYIMLTAGLAYVSNCEQCQIEFYRDGPLANLNWILITKIIAHKMA